jgi:drug/metabolite transporter (DMT)-like permease
MSDAQARRGFAYGFVAVVMFALTLPMTRLAVGDTSNPQLPPLFVTAGRAAVAGALATAYLLLVRARVPPRQAWGTLLVSGLGTVIGFPLFLALALREVPSMHAAVVTGVLPLGTAVVGAVVLRQRPSLGFWACALGGAALVVAFALLEGGGRPGLADGYLLLAILSTSFGYVAGARAAGAMPAQQVICWVLVGALPLTVPVALTSLPEGPVGTAAWLGFAYVSVFSMWLGLLVWYWGLSLGGVVRVSQVQLLQPFLSLVFAVPLLGEPLTVTTVGFALAIIGVVAAGRRMPVGVPQR